MSENQSAKRSMEWAMVKAHMKRMLLLYVHGEEEEYKKAKKVIKKFEEEMEDYHV